MLHLNFSGLPWRGGLSWMVVMENEKQLSRFTLILAVGVGAYIGFMFSSTTPGRAFGEFVNGPIFIACGVLAIVMTYRASNTRDDF